MEGREGKRKKWDEIGGKGIEGNRMEGNGGGRQKKGSENEGNNVNSVSRKERL
jgi:hypothetical protein